MNELTIDFKTYANSFGQGYLKGHKANAILMTLSQIPAIMDDEVRFLNYLKSCLVMEGFRFMDCELIMGWLYERKFVISG